MKPAKRLTSQFVRRLMKAEKEIQPKEDPPKPCKPRPVAISPFSYEAWLLEKEERRRIDYRAKYEKAKRKAVVRASLMVKRYRDKEKKPSDFDMYNALLKEGKCDHFGAHTIGEILDNDKFWNEFIKPK